MTKAQAPAQAEAQDDAQEASYTKGQFLSSRRFTTAQKDVLNALLTDDESYTDSKVTEIINNFLAQEAK